MKLPSLLNIVFIVGGFAGVHVNADFTYDANGNLRTDETFSYIFNDIGRVKEVRFGSDDGELIAEFFYDHNGQRIKKIENGKTCYYIGKLYQSCNDIDTKFHFLDGDRIASVRSTGDKTFFHNNHIGSLIVVSDEIGLITERISYEPYGGYSSISPTVSKTQYTFSGKQMDVMGAFYFEARNYSPHLSVFNSVDPVLPQLGDSFSLNPYQYANNNPLKFTDPNGTYSGVDDALAWGTGIIIGVASQGISDIFNGEISDYATYRASGLGGGAGGVATLYVGPLGGAIVGGAYTEALNQRHNGENLNLEQIIQKGAIDGVFSKTPGVKIPGITSGKGSWIQTKGQLNTNLKDNSISTMSDKSGGKWVGATIVESAPGELYKSGMMEIYEE